MSLNNCRLWLNMIRKRQRADVERESVFAPFSGSLLADRVLGELMTDQSHNLLENCYFTFCCLHNQHGSCMPSRRLQRLYTPLVELKDQSSLAQYHYSSISFIQDFNASIPSLNMCLIPPVRHSIGWVLIIFGTRRNCLFISSTQWSIQRK